MRNSAVFLSLLLALAATPALAAQDKPMTDDEPDAVDVAKTPVTDLNISKKEISAILLQAQDRPYSLTGIGRCGSLRSEVAALDEVLGPDLDLLMIRDRLQLVVVGIVFAQYRQGIAATTQNANIARAVHRHVQLPV